MEKIKIGNIILNKWEKSNSHENVWWKDSRNDLQIVGGFQYVQIETTPNGTYVWCSDELRLLFTSYTSKFDILLPFDNVIDAKNYIDQFLIKFNKIKAFL